jgi:ABC-type polysaccharide/polyol phosphate transport system ATPase subunit
MKPVVVVENVSKKFVRNPDTHLDYGVRALLNEILGRQHDTNLRRDEFLAVDNISFELYPGESFALVGRNGSGKTTTLQMLNGTLKPDAGKIVIDGRVQALIALGSGLDPRLSGWENIFNAAAVLGLNNQQTRAIVDEIIDFSELEDFIESPIQTYSSGMFARLGFSIAVHLNPEILLVDEILSVGDHAFKNKCFIKLNKLQADGTTIVLVSHSHSKVVQICERALWLQNGKTAMIGEAQEVVEKYIDFLEKLEIKNQEKQENEQKLGVVSQTHKHKNEGSEANLHLYGPIYDEPELIDNLSVEFLVNGTETSSVALHDSITIRFSFDLKDKVAKLNAPVVVMREDGLLMTVFTPLYSEKLTKVRSGHVACEVSVPDLVLNPGKYVLILPIMDGHSYIYRNVVKEFRVIGGKGKVRGLLDMKHEFRLVENGDLPQSTESRGN